MTTLSYDLVFAGNVAFDEIHPFRGETHTLFGSAVYFCAMAAAWSDKRIALVARMAERDAHLLDPVRKTRIAVHVSPSAETTRHRAIHLTEDVDNRQVFQLNSAGHFTMADMPPMEPTFVHLAGVTDEDFTVDFIRELRSRGFSCGVDMQAFVRRVDRQRRNRLVRRRRRQEGDRRHGGANQARRVRGRIPDGDVRLGPRGQAVREVGDLRDHGHSFRRGVGPSRRQELLRAIHESKRGRQNRAGRYRVWSVPRPKVGSWGRGLAEVCRRPGIHQGGDAWSLHGNGGAGSRESQDGDE